jgi:hypothetical protein
MAAPAAELPLSWMSTAPAAWGCVVRQRPERVGASAAGLAITPQVCGRRVAAPKRTPIALLPRDPLDYTRDHWRM